MRKRFVTGGIKLSEPEEKPQEGPRYEIKAQAGAHGFTLGIKNPISQSILYDPQTGVFELEVFEQLADIPNAPHLVSRLSLTIRPKQPNDRARTD